MSELNQDESQEMLQVPYDRSPILKTAKSLEGLHDLQDIIAECLRPSLKDGTVGTKRGGFNHSRIQLIDIVFFGDRLLKFRINKVKSKTYTEM